MLITFFRGHIKIIGNIYIFPPEADDNFTVSSGNREKILFIL